MKRARPDMNQPCSAVSFEEPCSKRTFLTGTVLINWIFIKESIFLYFMVEKLNRLT